MPLGPPDLSTTAIRFATPALRRRYPTATVSAEGLPVDGAPVDTPILVHHWPDPGALPERLPGGHDVSDVRSGTALAVPPGDALLLVASEAPGPRADSVVWRGVEYEVVKSAPRVVLENGEVTWSEFTMARVDR